MILIAYHKVLVILVMHVLQIDEKIMMFEYY